MSLAIVLIAVHRSGTLCLLGTKGAHCSRGVLRAAAGGVKRHRLGGRWLVTGQKECRLRERLIGSNWCHEWVDVGEALQKCKSVFVVSISD